MRRALTAAAALGAAALAASCFSERPTAADGPDGSAAGCRASVTAGDGVQAVVAIKDFAFSPDTLRIPAGTTVTWVNCDAATSGSPPHTTTSDGNVWASPLLPAAAAYTRRFDQPGAFPYHCEPHPFMKATVVVQ